MLDTAYSGARNLARRQTTPDRLIVDVVVLVIACVVFGAVGVWTARTHSGAARDLTSSDGRLLRDAQQIYVSLADADTTAASTYLAGGAEPAASRQRYLDDIGRAQFALPDVIRTSGTAVDTLVGQIPIYVGLIDTARADNLLGQPVGGAYLGEASTVMHGRLLPAADRLYAVEAGRVRADQNRGAAFAWPAVLIGLVVLGLLITAQIRLSRRTRRTFNFGLAGATGAVLLAMFALLVTFGIERSDVDRSRSRGSTRLELVARAEIAALRARGDECLVLVTGGEDADYVTDYASAVGVLGRDLALTGASARAHNAKWQVVHHKLVVSNDSGGYAGAVVLAIGTGPDDVPAAFDRLRTDLDSVAGTDQATFGREAAAARDATGYLAPALGVLAVLALGGVVGGMGVRIREYW